MTAGKTEAPPRVATQHGGAAPLAFLDVSECQTSAVECTKVTFHSPQVYRRKSDKPAETTYHDASRVDATLEISSSSDETVPPRIPSQKTDR